MTLNLRRLRRRDLPIDTATLARYLLGKVLTHDDGADTTSGRIVETEAYVIGDAAGHAYRGETRRNRSLFLRRGHAYVYFTYGCWYCVNISAETPGVGGGVLLRSLEPLQGIEVMQRRRPGHRLTDLARGPGRVCLAMAIDLRLDGVDVCCDSALWLGADRGEGRAIGESVRIGISRETERTLRFFERGSPFVSGPRRLRT